MTIEVVRHITQMRALVRAWQMRGKRVALVPTMGALHEGHLNLVRHGLEVADHVVATIFVNPKQFAAHEDLGRYPRTEEADIALLDSVGADLLFAPAAQEIYPHDFASNVHISGPALAGLEDKFRPQFFDGVATIVAKLFISAGADAAIFGEKDYQQLLVVRQMARDLNMPTEVIGLPTTREVDGLALSSRNRYLSSEERTLATTIIRALNQARTQILEGAKLQQAQQTAVASLNQAGFKIDYVEVRNALTLAHPTSNKEPLRLIAAAWLGKTRLIDNIAV